MKKLLGKPLAIALNVVGVGLLFYGMRQISDFYEKVYEIARTGSSSVGAQIGDFPPTITHYFVVLAAAGLCWWVSDIIRQRDAA